MLEEYKAENDNLKALKMPTQEPKEEQTMNEPQEEVQALKRENETLQEQLKEKDQRLEAESSKKWYQFWK